MSSFLLSSYETYEKSIYFILYLNNVIRAKINRTYLGMHRNFPHINLGMSKVCLTNIYGKWQI
jgi:hypothetical protein